MSKFKDNVSSKVFMWIGFGLAVLAVLMMFVPGLEHFQVLATKDRFWNVTGATHGFENGIWPVFVGYMLVLVGALILLVLALPFVNPQGKTELIALLVAAICLLAGAVLIYLTRIFYVTLNPKIDGMVVTQLAGPYLGGSFAVLAFACDGVAFYLDM